MSQHQTETNGKKLLSTIWPIIASVLAAGAFVIQLAMSYSSTATGQHSQLLHTNAMLEKIDQRMEKIDNRVFSLEAQSIQNSAEFRVQIKGLQEEMAALRDDLRNLRHSSP